MAEATRELGKGHRARLRERFERTGLDGFAEHEVVELLLTLCIPRSDVKEPAKALVAEYGSLKGVLDAPAEGLRAVKGLGSVTPVALRILKAVLTRYLQQSAEEQPCLDNVDLLGDLFRARLSELSHEVFEVAFLNKRFQLMPNGVMRISTGLPDRTMVYPRQIVQFALARHAVWIVLAHNHPSGQLEASPEDHLLTQRVVEAAQVVGLRVLDHIIVTPSDTLSFLDQGWLEGPD
ncbi:MAG: RadC family protein [Opitutales bacterium]